MGLAEIEALFVAERTDVIFEFLAVEWLWQNLSCYFVPLVPINSICEPPVRANVCPRPRLFAVNVQLETWFLLRHFRMLEVENCFFNYGSDVLFFGCAKHWPSFLFCLFHPLIASLADVARDICHC